MGSLDLGAFFTSIPLDETIVDICVNQLFKNTDIVESFRKSKLKQLLRFATNGSSLIANNWFTSKLLVWIGSPSLILPLNLPLLKHLLILFKKLVNWLKSCPQKFEPDFCRYFVEAAFCPLQLNDYLKCFQQFLNSCYINMSFLRKQKDKTNFPLSMLKLFAKKVNLQPHVFVNVLLVEYIVTLKGFTFCLKIWWGIHFSL